MVHEPYTLSVDTSIEDITAQISTTREFLEKLGMISKAKIDQAHADKCVKRITESIDESKCILSDIHNKCLALFGSEEHINHMMRLLVKLGNREKYENRLEDQKEKSFQRICNAELMVSSAKQNLHELETDNMDERDAERTLNHLERIVRHAEETLEKVNYQEEINKELNIAVTKEKITLLSGEIQSMNEKTMTLFTLSPEVVEFINPEL